MELQSSTRANEAEDLARASCGMYLLENLHTHSNEATMADAEGNYAHSPLDLV